MASLMPVLVADAVAIGLPVVGVMIVTVLLLLRSRVRCPKDRTALKLVPPDAGHPGHHMVFRCPKCGYHKRSKIPVGRR